MQCPRDHSDLEAQSYEGVVEIDRCPSCAGVWLDRGELETIQKASERGALHLHDIPRDSVGRSINEVAQLEARDVPCPRCSARMSHHDYGFGAQIVIDVCPADCGVWLDVGELQQLEAFYERSTTEASAVLPVGFWLRERLYALFAKAGKQ